MSNWDKRFLQLADHISTWSKDPSTKIGVVCVSPERQILSIGWNGFPRGIEDTNERLNDREVKYELTSHGEMNCIYNATLNGMSLKNSTLYVNFPVCNECAKAIIQVGISCVVIPTINTYLINNSDTYAAWIERWEKSKKLFFEAGVLTMEIDKI